MLQPVSAFLEMIGCYVVLPELKFVDRGIDLYGVTSSPDSVTYAVELKLTRWQKALRQAYIYQLCCDFSYVALPLSTVANVDLSQFELSGVGLLSVLQSGWVTEVVAPRKSVAQRALYRDTFVRIADGEYVDAGK